MIALSSRIIELESQYGGLRAAARALNCDAAYLLRLRDKKKSNPSATMLRKLGLKKVVTYVQTAHTCDWREDEDGNYWTACGRGFSITEGTPKQNGMKFCCYCGKPLTTHKEMK